MRARSGAALIFALLLLVVLDCVIIGTVHLAMLERRIADNATAALRLRVAAESIVRATLAAWPDALDTLRTGVPITGAHGVTADGYVQRASIERLAGDLFAVRGTAEETSGTGRSAALLIVTPPAFPPRSELATAAVSVRGTAQVSGSITAGPTADCPANPSVALRVTALDRLAMHEDAVDGDVAYYPSSDDYSVLIPQAIRRLRGHSGGELRIVSGDLHLDAAFNGVLVIDGNLTIPAGVEVTGLILASGTVILETGASVTGALHAGGDVSIPGAVTLDACTVERLIGRTRLMAPRPAPTRAWLPAF